MGFWLVLAHSVVFLVDLVLGVRVGSREQDPRIRRAAATGAPASVPPSPRLTRGERLLLAVLATALAAPTAARVTRQTPIPSARHARCGPVRRRDVLCGLINEYAA